MGTTGGKSKRRSTTDDRHLPIRFLGLFAICFLGYWFVYGIIEGEWLMSVICAALGLFGFAIYRVVANDKPSRRRN